VAQILFFIFIVIFLVALVAGRRRPPRVWIFSGWRGNALRSIMTGSRG